MSIVLPTSGNLEKNTSCMLAYATHTLSHSTSNGMPGTHKAQAMVGWALKLPLEHAVHAVAPTASSTLVVDPGLQTAHGWVAVELNCPAWQTMHRVPPELPSVSVTEPGGHSTHSAVGSALY